MELAVVIVAETASLRLGGEAALPVHYYRILRQRQIPVWLVVHERTRSELEALFPLDADRIVFVADTRAHVLAWRFSQLLPDRIAEFTTGFLIRYLTQRAQRREIRRLLGEHSISLIHQPSPVSPREPSFIFGMGVPVIIGPMNGGMQYPPGFHELEGWMERLFIATGRSLSDFMNFLIPGKRQAAMLLVANERTRAALPRRVSSNVVVLVENGVDLSRWSASDSSAVRQATAAVQPAPALARFVFMGRLVSWKAVDLLLLAFKRASNETAMTLSIIGSGNERVKLEELARSLAILGDSADQPGKVCFLGWMSQEDCAQRLAGCNALVLPSMAECGGAVVLEAMAMEVPVIATAWGGPLDYLDSSCGILVDPSSKESFLDDLAMALIRLATHDQDRRAMGRAGRLKVLKEFDWEEKVNQVLEHYRSCIGVFARNSRRVGSSELDSDSGK